MPQSSWNCSSMNSGAAPIYCLLAGTVDATRRLWRRCIAMDMHQPSPATGSSVSGGNTINRIAWWGNCTLFLNGTELIDACAHDFGEKHQTGPARPAAAAAGHTLLPPLQSACFLSGNSKHDLLKCNLFEAGGHGGRALAQCHMQPARCAAISGSKLLTGHACLPILSAAQ